MQSLPKSTNGENAQNPSTTAIFAFVPSLIVIILCFWNWYSDIQADKTAKTTVGVIIQNRSRDYRYKYTVDGAEYIGEEIIKGGSPMPEGKEVRVTYRPEDPATSTLTPPSGTQIADRCQ